MLLAFVLMLVKYRRLKIVNKVCITAPLTCTIDFDYRECSSAALFGCSRRGDFRAQKADGLGIEIKPPRNAAWAAPPIGIAGRIQWVGEQRTRVEVPDIRVPKALLQASFICTTPAINIAPSADILIIIALDEMAHSSNSAGTWTLRPTTYWTQRVWPTIRCWKLGVQSIRPGLSSIISHIIRSPICGSSTYLSPTFRVLWTQICSVSAS